MLSISSGFPHPILRSLLLDSGVVVFEDRVY
jgi:hypothetical protein